MERVICVNGHYYDGSKYKECPHCASGMRPVVSSVFAEARDTSQDRDGKGKSEEKISDRLKKKLFGGKEGHWGKDNQGNLNQERYSRGRQEAEQGSIWKSSRETKIMEVQRNTGNSYQKTEFVNREENREWKDEEHTIGFFSTGKNMEPPVGYLICIEGADYGSGFPLKSGNNSIGRSPSMDVVVTDPKVSREKQAYVMYEPHKREFFLKPGDSAGLCYLNEEVALEPKKLQAHDVILLGSTRLMLIPVCDEKFSWKEGY